MESRSLLYFIAVAEEKNIGRAALRLHITQSALSKQIQSLEEETGVPLFIRTGTGVEITPSGMALLQHARVIRTELAQAKANILHAASKLTPWLDIGVYGSSIFSVLPQILTRFAQSHPEIELRLHHTRKDQLVELLRQGKILIAFDRMTPLEPDLICEPVFHEEYSHVALHKDHPLASREIIDIKDLENEQRIGSNLDRALADNLSRFSGFRQTAKHRADDLFTALTLVGCGLGITFVPLSIQKLQIPNVVYRPHSGGDKLALNFQFQCIYRKDDQSDLLQEILKTIHEFRETQSLNQGITGA